MKPISEQQVRFGQPPVGWVPTGWDRFDKLADVLHPGHLVVVAGAPAVGKTSFVLNIALRAAGSGVNVLAVTPDTPAFEAVLRMTAMVGELPAQLLRAGVVTAAEADRAASAVVALPIVLEDKAPMSVEDLEACVCAFRGINAGRVLVVVDSIHSFKSQIRGETAEREIAEVVRGLKIIARRFDLPMLAVSELNRNWLNREDRRPHLDDLRGSGVIENCADALLFLHICQHGDRSSRHNAEVIVAKQQLARTGSARLSYRGWCGRFDELPASDEESLP